MKIATLRRRKTPFFKKAFTLAEFLIALAIMSLVGGASLAIYLYGFRMVQVIRPKLTASADTRKTLALLTDDVRTAYKIRLGTRATGGAFTELPLFSAQIASAMMINSSTNTNKFALYFWDSSDETVRRSTNNSRGVIVASGVTNELIFTAEDYRGLPHTNTMASTVIGVNLQYYQRQYSKAASTKPGYVDYYQFRTRINKRAYF
jgi:prepilin-type N-terminal cleavage/methylation domain-containing protein